MNSNYLDMTNNEHNLLLEWLKYCEIQAECQDVCRLRTTYMNYALLFPDTRKTYKS